MITFASSFCLFSELARFLLLPAHPTLFVPSNLPFFLIVAAEPISFTQTMRQVHGQILECVIETRPRANVQKNQFRRPPRVLRDGDYVRNHQYLVPASVSGTLQFGVVSFTLHGNPLRWVLWPSAGFGLSGVHSPFSW